MFRQTEKRFDKYRSSAIFLSVCAVLLTLSPAANAQFYISAQGGMNLLNDSRVEQSGLSGQVTFENGFSVGGAVGFAWSDHIRTELEVTHRRNDLDTITVAAFGLPASGALDGDVSSTAVMVNGFYDFRIGGPDGRIIPYVGGGIGVARIDVNGIKVSGSAAPGADFDDTVFAFQLGGGVVFNLTKSIGLTFDYRYFQAADPVFSGSGVPGGDTNAEYRSHTVTAGIRLKI